MARVRVWLEALGTRKSNIHESAVYNHLNCMNSSFLPYFYF